MAAQPALSTTTPSPSKYFGEVAYWICPRGSGVRHATTTRPGALVNGSAIKALGGCAITVPMATPNDRVPRSRPVTAQCEDCKAVVVERGLISRIWDF
ncbi:hypothetical protein HUO13_18495 [Saccharopolyspora erythraea]|uniref:hypothetical protein n=1 Tax=Saccharopolyspora erythraea TaxID=1836 RepID=UPI001BAA5B2C|nr:hypothetical protein [Saccharopolyspora erythraea]QUH02528.1 hypothetical protein HUO13_18495 [Saccharopolyspora erythraea]